MVIQRVSGSWAGGCGGIDSRVLLQVLLDAGLDNLVICHLDHRLRGKESDTENIFIRRLAGRLKLPIFEEHIERWPPKLSIESAARQASHRFFARAAKTPKALHVFLGQHAHEQIETFLLDI